MTMTLKDIFFLYWSFSIVFQTIYVITELKKIWEKLKHDETLITALFLNILFLVIRKSFHKNKKYFSPVNICLIFCIIAPILFPFYLMELIREQLFKKKIRK
jgi:uncharacterized membrane protein YagU involved in acid resistance